MQLALPPRGTPRPCAERTSGTSGTPARQHTHGLLRDAPVDGETDARPRRHATSSESRPRGVAGVEVGDQGERRRRRRAKRTEIATRRRRAGP